MARAVDADRESARDRESALGEIACELLRDVAAAAVGLRLPTMRAAAPESSAAVLALHPECERRVGELARAAADIVARRPWSRAVGVRREPRARAIEICAVGGLELGDGFLVETERAQCSLRAPDERVGSAATFLALPARQRLPARPRRRAASARRRSPWPCARRRSCGRSESCGAVLRGCGPCRAR